MLLISSIFINNTHSLFANEVISKDNVKKSVKVADVKPPTIDVASLKVDKKEVKPGDTVKISLKASDDMSGIRQLDIRYKKPITGREEDIRMKYNSQKDIYEGSLYIDEQTEDGLWKIQFIFLGDNKDNYGYIYNSNLNNYGKDSVDLSGGNFKVSGTNQDVKVPTIDVSSLKVDKKEVKPGDTVKVSVKANDDISGIRQIDIRYKRPITGREEDIRMKYNSQKDIYEGSLYIDEQTEDGLWKIQFIFLGDNKDNYGYIYNSNLNNYGKDSVDLSGGNFKVVYKNSGWSYDSGTWYYYLNGVKQTGWINDGGRWYYLKLNGAMATGWLNLNGVWYYLESSGAMATGWKKINGTWYYLETSGAMKTGWLKENNNWYYLEPSGAMATGWKKINGTWYYLETSGAMKTGWLKENNNWYYLEPSGAMATGWEKVNGTWYYFYSSGVMATNTTIDGWKIDGNGVATPISNSNNNNSSSQVQGTVYITPNGKSYHSTKNCTALKRSTTILSVSLQEAINKGKSDACNLCVH